MYTGKPPSDQWSWRLYPEPLSHLNLLSSPLLKLPGGDFHSLVAGIQHECNFRQEQNTSQPEMWPIKETQGDDPLQLPCKEDEKGLSTKLE